MRAIKKFAALGIVAALSLVTVGCSQDQAPPGAGPEKITVDFATLGPSSLLWTFYIAKDQGFFDDQGVEINQIVTQNSALLVQAVASGSAAMGIGQSDNLIKAVDEGAGVIALGSTTERNESRLIGAPGVNNIPELRGKRVSAGAVSGGTGDMLIALMDTGGLEQGSYEIVAIPNSADRIVGIQNKQLEGALLIPPYDSTALADGGKVLAEYDAPYIGQMLVANTSWLKSNKDAAERVARAMAKAAAWLFDTANRDNAQEILRAATNAASQSANDAYEFLVLGAVFSKDMRVTLDGLQNVVNLGASVHGGTPRSLDLKLYLNDSYIK